MRRWPTPPSRAKRRAPSSLEKAADISRELYLSLFLNRSKRCYTVIASAEGGVEIESVKNQVVREVGLGDVDAQTARQVAADLGLSGGQAGGLVSVLTSLSRLTVEKEAEACRDKPACGPCGRLAAGARRQGHDRRQLGLSPPRA